MPHVARQGSRMMWLPGGRGARAGRGRAEHQARDGRGSLAPVTTAPAAAPIPRAATARAAPRRPVPARMPATSRAAVPPAGRSDRRSLVCPTRWSHHGDAGARCARRVTATPAPRPTAMSAATLAGLIGTRLLDVRCRRPGLCCLAWLSAGRRTVCSARSTGAVGRHDRWPVRRERTRSSGLCRRSADADVRRPVRSGIGLRRPKQRAAATILGHSAGLCVRPSHCGAFADGTHRAQAQACRSVVRCAREAWPSLPCS